VIFELAQDFHDAVASMPSGHPRHWILELLEEAIHGDIHFIARHPTTLFQCMWNTCWWYDCPEAAKHYKEPEGGWSIGESAQPWVKPGPRLHKLIEAWHAAREKTAPGFFWLRSHRPPAVRLGTGQLAVFGPVMIAETVAFSPDGCRLACTSMDSTLRVWDTRTGTEVTVLRDRIGRVSTIAFCPDGRHIAGGRRHGTVSLWDVDRGEEIAVLHGHIDQVVAVAFSPDGKQIVSGSLDGIVHVWGVQKGEAVADLYEHDSMVEVQAVAFSPDGETISACGKDGNVRTWNLRSGGVSGNVWLVYHLRHRDGITAAAFSRDGRRTVTGEYGDWTVRVWDTRTGGEIAILRGHTSTVHAVAISLDGRRIASSSTDGTVRLWDVEKKDEPVVLRGHVDKVVAVAFSPDGRRIASGSWDGTVRLWNAQTETRIPALRGHQMDVDPVDRPREIVSVSFSSDGSRIATGSSCDGAVRVWDEESGREIVVLPREEPIDAVAISLTGRRIIIAGMSIVVWDLDAGAEVRTLRGSECRFTGPVAFSPDVQRVASGDYMNRVLVWNAENGRLIAVLHGHKGEILSVAFSPDGRWVATGSEDKTVRVWNVETRRNVAVLRGHEGEVFAVEFSPEGRRLASLSDETVRVWDWEHANEIIVLRGHENTPGVVVFSPDGRRIVTGSLGSWGPFCMSIGQANVCVWDVSSGALLEVIHGTADVVAIAAGPSRFRFRALGRWEGTIIERQDNAEPIAWFPTVLDRIVSHPSGHIWAGTQADNFVIIGLEGGEML
jgi:WD40 repeat protein